MFKFTVFNYNISINVTSFFFTDITFLTNLSFINKIQIIRQ